MLGGLGILLLCLMLGVFSWSVLTRIPLEMTVIRDRNTLFVETDDGGVENIYRLRIVNMDREGHTFSLSVDGVEGAEIRGPTRFDLEGSEIREINLRVRANADALAAPSTELRFEIVADDMSSLRTVSESRFLKPL